MVILDNILKTLVLGVGNLILRDDGIGPRLIHELQGIVTDPDVTLQETSLSGINLMELLIGFDRAIIIDAIQNKGIPGKSYWLTSGDFDNQYKDIYSNHKISLFQAIELGNDLNQPMPAEVDIMAIEAKDVTGFGEELTPEVERAIPIILEQILAKLDEGSVC